MKDQETFTTIADAIYYVDMALSTSDGYPDDYDIEAIANDITDWQDGKLVLTANDDDSFWNVVMSHMRK